jgi:thioredoxin reductase
MHEPRIAILGAGPIGLEAALAAAEAGGSVLVFERGLPGAHVRAWGHIRMFSPWRMNVSARALRALAAADSSFTAPPADECPTGHEFVERYLRPLADLPAVKSILHLHHEVLGVAREGIGKHEAIASPSRAAHPFRILVRDDEGRLAVHHADVVLDTTGVYGQPQPAGSGGIPAPGEAAAADRIAYGAVDVTGAQREDYLGRRTMVVGGGHTAATAVIDLGKLAAEAANTAVVWVRRTRRPFANSSADPLAARRALEAEANRLLTAGEPWLSVCDEAEVHAIERRRTALGVTLCTPDETLEVEVERIIAATGFRPDRELSRELEVHECYASAAPMKLGAALLVDGTADCLSTPAAGIDQLRNPEPNFFIVGAKSYGRMPTFLLRTGLRQVEDVLQASGLAVPHEDEAQVLNALRGAGGAKVEAPTPTAPAASRPV